MLSIMEKNRNSIQVELATLTFYMEGGISFSDAHLLSSSQREVLSKTIEKHYAALSNKKGSNLVG